MLQVFHMREGPEKLLTPCLIARALVYRATRAFGKASNQVAKAGFFSRLLVSQSPLTPALDACPHTLNAHNVCQTGRGVSLWSMRAVAKHPMIAPESISGAVAP